MPADTDPLERPNFDLRPSSARVSHSMNNALRNGFPPFVNEQDLRSAIASVCAAFGKVSYLEILPAMRETNSTCLCFLRLDSAAAEAALRAKLDVVEFDSKFAFFADVDEKWTGPST